MKQSPIWPCASFSLVRVIPQCTQVIHFLAWKVQARVSTGFFRETIRALIDTLEEIIYRTICRSSFTLGQIQTSDAANNFADTIYLYSIKKTKNLPLRRYFLAL